MGNTWLLALRSSLFLLALFLHRLHDVPVRTRNDRWWCGRASRRPTKMSARTQTVPWSARGLGALYVCLTSMTAAAHPSRETVVRQPQRFSGETHKEGPGSKRTSSEIAAGSREHLLPNHCAKKTRLPRGSYPLVKKTTARLRDLTGKTRKEIEPHVRRIARASVDTLKLLAGYMALVEDWRNFFGHSDGLDRLHAMADIAEQTSSVSHEVYDLIFALDRRNFFGRTCGSTPEVLRRIKGPLVKIKKAAEPLGEKAFQVLTKRLRGFNVWDLRGSPFDLREYESGSDDYMEARAKRFEVLARMAKVAGTLTPEAFAAFHHLLTETDDQRIAIVAEIKRTSGDAAASILTTLAKGSFCGVDVEENLQDIAELSTPLRHYRFTKVTDLIRKRKKLDLGDMAEVRDKTRISYGDASILRSIQSAQGYSPKRLTARQYRTRQQAIIDLLFAPNKELARDKYDLLAKLCSAEERQHLRDLYLFGRAGVDRFGLFVGPLIGEVLRDWERDHPGQLADDWLILESKTRAETLLTRRARGNQHVASHPVMSFSDDPSDFAHLDVGHWREGTELLTDFDHNGLSPPDRAAFHPIHLFIERLFRQRHKGLSFKKNLRGAKVVFAGLGRDPKLVLDLLEKRPKVGAVHVADIDTQVFYLLNLALGTRAKPMPRRPIADRVNLLNLPLEWTNRFDIYHDQAVFDSEAKYGTLLFGSQAVGQALTEIARVLKPGGVHISVEPYAITEYPPELPMKYLGPLELGETAHAFMKVE